MNLRRILVSLFVIALPIVAPIVWDKYKSYTAFRVVRYPGYQLISEREPILQHLRLLVDHKQLTNLYVEHYKIENTGNVTIDSQLVETFPTFTFPPQNLIVRIIPKNEPQNIQTFVSVLRDQRTATISFKSLNPGEWIGLSFYLTGDLQSRGEVKINTRLKSAATPEITDIDSVERARRRPFDYAALLPPLAILAFALVSGSRLKRYSLLYKTFRAKLREGNDGPLAQLKDSADIERFIDEDLDFLFSHQQNQLRQVLEDVPHFKSQLLAVKHLVRSYTTTLPDLVLFYYGSYVVVFIGFGWALWGSIFLLLG